MRKVIAMSGVAFVLTGFLWVSVDRVIAINPPPTPTDEQKAEWQRMGEENQRKYGAEPDANTLNTPAPVADDEIDVMPSPTASVSATPLPVDESGEAIVSEQSEVAVAESGVVRRMWQSLTSWLAGLLGW